MDDDKLAIEEARRAGQHCSVKSQVEGEVQAEIAEHAARPAQPEAAKVGQVAEEFRAKAVAKLSRLNAKSDAHAASREFRRL